VEIVMRTVNTLLALSILGLAACAAPAEDSSEQGTSDVSAVTAMHALVPNGDLGLLECSKAETGAFDFSVAFWYDSITGKLEQRVELDDHHVVDPNADTVSASGRDRGVPVFVGDRPEFFKFESDIPPMQGHGGYYYEPGYDALPTSVVVTKAASGLVAEGKVKEREGKWSCVVWKRTTRHSPWKRVL